MRILRLLTIAAFTAACQSSDPHPGSTESPPSGMEEAPVNGTASSSPDGAGGPSPDLPPSPPPTGSADDSHALTPRGWGPLRIGMTRAEVVSAAGEDANPDAVGGPEPERCDQFRPTEAPEGMLAMIEDGRLTRISISKRAGVVTEEGFGIGASADSVAAAYGDRAIVGPHKYLAAPGAYITVWETEPGQGEPRGIVYEIGLDGRVQHIHAGGSSIQYVEGCL